MCSKKYQCPRQKKLLIPHSRFHDGVCDCCDGSDEPSGVCPDICDQVLAEERALREKMAREFSKGNALRQKQIEEFHKILKEKQEEKVKTDEKLDHVKEQVGKVEAELHEVKYKHMQQRLDRIAKLAKGVGSSSGVNESMSGLLEPLTNDEIVSLIIHSCQMAGEMDRAKDMDETTCVPLRLAGLDAGILWGLEKDGKADFKRLQLNVQEEGKLLADIFVTNGMAEKDEDKQFLEEPNKKRRKKHKRGNKPGRRRLQEVDSGDSPEDDYIDDYYGDDMYDPDLDTETDLDEQEEEPKNEEAERSILDKIKESIFSQPRMAFLQRSQEIIDGIDDLLKEVDDDEKKDGEENADEASKEPIDPAAYNMVKATLEKREDAIERGYDYAVSATELLNSMREATPDQDQLRQDLFTLSVGTLVYGKLSASHVWQLFQAILPEFNKETEDPTDNEHTCAASPWAAKCPPRAVTRSTASLPPKPILEAAAILCTTPTFTNEKAQVCAADTEDVLPTVMPDGYRGYEEVHPREDDDIFEKVAAEWDIPMSGELKGKLSDLNDKKDNLSKEQRDIEKEVEDISDVVDGAQENRFGLDGELFALKDKCYSTKAGKYTYEVCVFGSATQKEGDSKGGTGLGKFEGVEYEEESGKRILKWTNGVKCWNGPNRSATAYITCGAKTKVLSADEPDTCRYVLQMESHIACDESFRQIHEL